MTFIMIDVVIIVVCAILFAGHFRTVRWIPSPAPVIAVIPFSLASIGLIATAHLVVIGSDMLIGMNYGEMHTVLVWIHRLILLATGAGVMHAWHLMTK